MLHYDIENALKAARKFCSMLVVDQPDALKENLRVCKSFSAVATLRSSVSRLNTIISGRPAASDTNFVGAAVTQKSQIDIPARNIT